jgi:hypothetical protein
MNWFRQLQTAEKNQSEVMAAPKLGVVEGGD